MKNSVSPSEAFSLISGQAQAYILVDVRSPAEFKTIHAETAVNIPLELVTAAESLAQMKGKRVLCICKSGMRSEKAAKLLAGVGVSDAINVEGGTVAWDECNLPVVKGT